MKRFIVLAAFAVTASLAWGHAPAIAGTTVTVIEVPCPPDAQASAVKKVVKKKVVKKKTVVAKVVKKVTTVKKHVVKKAHKAKAAVVRVITPKKCYETIVTETPRVLPKQVQPAPAPAPGIIPEPKAVEKARKYLESIAPPVKERTPKEVCESKGGWWNTAVPYCEYQSP